MPKNTTHVHVHRTYIMSIAKVLLKKCLKLISHLMMMLLDVVPLSIPRDPVCL